MSERDVRTVIVQVAGLFFILHFPTHVRQFETQWQLYGNSNDGRGLVLFTAISESLDAAQG